MIKEIVTDNFFLSQKAKPATKEDQAVIQDLKDTLKAHRHHCVGMAANMIGINKAIIIVAMGPLDLVMVNPEITFQAKPYQTQEGCLSHTGQKPTQRYQEIQVQYLDEHFHPKNRRFQGPLAQVIQHEMDHLAGILI